MDQSNKLKVIHLERLLEICRIGEIPVVHGDSHSIELQEFPIIVDHYKQQIVFCFDEECIPERYQIRIKHMIHFLAMNLRILNDELPCMENQSALDGLNHALDSLEAREKRRARQNLTGKKEESEENKPIELNEMQEGEVPDVLDLNEMMPALTIINPWNDRVVWSETFLPDSEDEGSDTESIMGQKLDALLNHFIIKACRSRVVMPKPVAQGYDEKRDLILASVDGFMVRFNREEYERLYGKLKDQDYKDLERKTRYLEGKYLEEKHGVKPTRRELRKFNQEAGKRIAEIKEKVVRFETLNESELTRLRNLVEAL